MLDAVKLVGEIGVLRLVGVEPGEPGVAQLLAPPADPLLEVLVDAVGNQELRILRPAVKLLGEPDLFLPQGSPWAPWVSCLWGDPQAIWLSTMIRVGRSLVSRKICEGALQHVQIVGVAHPGHVPAVRHEPLGNVLAEGQRRVPLDGDVVVVVDPAEVREAEMSGQRGGLVRDAFHHVAVAAQSVDVEVDQVLESGLVEVRRQEALGHGHAHGVGNALAERSGRGLDPGRQPVFGMSGALAVQLAKLLHVLQRDGRVPSVSYWLLTACTPVKCRSE